MNEPIMFSVDAEALRQVLEALIGPPHLIRELQVTRGPLFGNPIDKLIEQFNAQAAALEATQPQENGGAS